MSKVSTSMKKFGAFMKKNAFYFLIILCIASVATVIALAVTHNATNPSIDSNIDDQPVIKPDDDPNKGDNNGGNTDDKKPLTFLSPCNDGTVINNFSDTQLVWNQSMKEFATHTAIDFTSSDQNVYAAADGVVKEIGHNDLDGYYVIISHEEGYTTKYLSLAETVSLKANDKVEQGQLLGKMSTSQGRESLDGAHLHFEIWKDGEAINPLEVLVLGEK